MSRCRNVTMCTKGHVYVFWVDAFPVLHPSQDKDGLDPHHEQRCHFTRSLVLNNFLRGFEHPLSLLLALGHAPTPPLPIMLAAEDEADATVLPNINVVNVVKYKCSNICAHSMPLAPKKTHVSVAKITRGPQRCFQNRDRISIVCNKVMLKCYCY